jgi:hypothetical protein
MLSIGGCHFDVNRRKVCRVYDLWEQSAVKWADFDNETHEGGGGNYIPFGEEIAARSMRIDLSAAENGSIDFLRRPQHLQRSGGGCSGSVLRPGGLAVLSGIG